VVAKVRQRLSVSKQVAQKFYVEIFNVQKLNVAVKEEYQVKISNRFAALMVMMMWTSVGLGKFYNMKASATGNLGYCELKQYKPWFEEC
jgi:hypothetical protein